MYSPPAPRPTLSILGFLSKLTKDSAVSSGKGMVWLVSLEVILYQLIHVVSPTSKEMKELGIEFRRSAFSHCFSWVPRRAEGLICSYRVREGKSGEQGWRSRVVKQRRKGSHVRVCYWAGHLQGQLTSLQDPVPEKPASWGYRVGRRRKTVSTLFCAIGRVFAQGAFLLLLLWVVCTWMRPLYRVKKEALGQEVRGSYAR